MTGNRGVLRSSVRQLLSWRGGRIAAGVVVATLLLSAQMAVRQFTLRNSRPLGPSLPPYPTFIAPPQPALSNNLAPVAATAQPAADIKTQCGGPPQMLVLAIGADTDTGGFERGLADVIRIVRVDFVTPAVHVLTIPRDLWVAIPGAEPYAPAEYFGAPLGPDGQPIETAINMGRINSAYFYGNLYDLPGGGPGTLAQTIYFAFSLPVDHYVAVDMALIADVIDELGGVDVNVQTPAEDFPAGLTRMDGETAVLYARQRQADTDFLRSERQNEVLMALRQELLKPAVLPHVPDLVDAFLGRTLTDLSRQQIATFTCLLGQLDESNIDNHTITGEMGTATYTTNGSYVLLPDYDAIAAELREFMSDDHATE